MICTNFKKNNVLPYIYATEHTNSPDPQTALWGVIGTVLQMKQLRLRIIR